MYPRRFKTDRRNAAHRQCARDADSLDAEHGTLSNQFDAHMYNSYSTVTDTNPQTLLIGGAKTA